MRAPRSRHACGAAVACGLAACLVLIACGKRGDPLPPLRRTPLPVTEFKIAQRGDTLEISYVAPRSSTDGARLPVLDVELLRADGPGEFAKTATRTARKTAPGERVTLTEPLPPPATDLRYSAVAVSKGRPSPQAFVRSHRVVAVPPAPLELLARSSPAGVSLAWSAPKPMPDWIEPAPAPQPAAPPSAASAGGSTPGASPSPAATPTPGPTPTPAPTPPPPPRPGGFNLYRRVGGGAGYGRPLTPTPVETASHEDQTAEAGLSYCYVARTAIASDPLIESEASNEACLDVRDVRAPEAPSGLATLPVADAIEVSWSPSSEPDLAHYLVFRSAGGAAPERLAEVAPPATAFQDTSARAGLRYRYSLVAVDRAGNQSAASSPVDAVR